MRRPFRQVDVFTTTPYAGNPVAVVLDAERLDAEQMQRVAHWTNLSETTFVLPPTEERADYRVRIFMPTGELPFAGHPTLGTCHAWLETGGRPRRDDVIVQECGAGLVEVRRTDQGLAFAGPPLVRSGRVEDEMVDRIVAALGVTRDALVDTQWVDNGPGWVAALLESADAVLAAQVQTLDFDLGLVGPHTARGDAAFEVRGFFPKDGMAVEDPVTGSLNASLAEWLIGSGRATPPYVAAQGTALGRAGRVHVSRDADDRVWVGGGTVTCITGEIEI